MKPRTIIGSILLAMLICVVGIGIWLIATLKDDSDDLSAGTVSAPATTPGSSRSQKPSPRPRRNEEATIVPPPAPSARGYPVTGAMAAELKLTGEEQARINAIYDEVQEKRRELFTALSNREKDETEASEEMTEIRRQMNDDLRDLLGHQRTADLFEAIQKEASQSQANDRSR